MGFHDRVLGVAQDLGLTMAQNQNWDQLTTEDFSWDRMININGIELCGSLALNYMGI